MSLLVKASVGGVRVTRVQRFRTDIDKSWFEGAPGGDQYMALRDEYASANNSSDDVKGIIAKKLRGWVESMKLDYLFELKNKTADGSRRRFMNEELRDFLNLKEDGTMNYTYEELTAPKSRWKETDSIGALYHQSDVYGSYLNAKFVCGDGREVVFDYNKMIVNSYPDKGTFNYVNAEVLPTVLSYVPYVPEDGHTLYDVEPYFELMRTQGYNIVGRMYAIPDNDTLPRNMRYLGVPVELIKGGLLPGSGFLKKNSKYWPQD